MAPEKEFPEVDLTIVPGKMAEARIGLASGSRAEVVRAHSNGALIFCQRYEFHAQESVRSPVGGVPGSRASYSVEIVEGHMAEGCQDSGASE